MRTRDMHHSGGVAFKCFHYPTVFGKKLQNNRFSGFDSQSQEILVVLLNFMLIVVPIDLIELPMVLQWKLKNILAAKQPKFTETSTP